MNDGVKILLARMETHPEEFAYNPNEGAGKWSKLLNLFRHALTKEEIDALDEGVRDIERTRFTELVMQELLDPHEPTNLQQLLDLKERRQASQLLPSSRQKVVEQILNSKEVKAEMTTTLGKLFNYT